MPKFSPCNHYQHRCELVRRGTEGFNVRKKVKEKRDRLEGFPMYMDVVFLHTNGDDGRKEGTVLN